MVSLTPLIIIASAFSVFGQYISNRQQGDVDTIKKGINSVNISKIKTRSMRSYFENQQAELVKEGRALCDSTLGPVQALFGLLIFALGLEMCFTLHQPEWWNVAYVLFGGVEIVISLWLGSVLYRRKTSLRPWNEKSEKFISVVNAAEAGKPSSRDYSEGS